MNLHSYISNFKKILPFLLGGSIIITSVVFINMFIDCKGVYKQSDIHYRTYIKELLDSNLPKTLPTLADERYIKYFLGEMINSETYLLGSSRGFKITSDLLGKPLINLSVSGGSNEDAITFLGMLLEKRIPPKQVYIIIDPWFFHKNSDIRYLALLQFYQKSLATLGILDAQLPRNFFLRQKIKNLINGEYCAANLKFLYASIFGHGNSVEEHNGSLNKDGSLNYSAVYEEEKRIPKFLPINEFQYKAEAFQIQKEVIKNWSKILDKFSAAGIQITFIVLPYHPRIMDSDLQPLKKQLDEFYRFIQGFAKDNNIHLIGNIFPNSYGLKAEDYYDPIHLKTSGLLKLHLELM